MRKINKVNYLNREGLVHHCTPVADWSFLYEVSSVKDPKWTIGDRVVLPDGRVFRYALASGTVNPEVGVYKAKKTNTNAVAPAQATAASLGTTLAAGVVGSNAITVTIDTEIGVLTTGALSVDELSGGYIVIGNGTSQHPQMRQIRGHAALTSAGGSLTLILDAPLVTDVTVGTTNIELMENPFYNLKADNSGGEYVTYLGVAAMVAASGQYFWVQTWGPAWVTSDGNTCDSALDRTLVWVGNGSVVSSNDITVENGLQVAGVALDMSGSSASNAPMVLLQIWP